MSPRLKEISDLIKNKDRLRIYKYLHPSDVFLKISKLSRNEREMIKSLYNDSEWITKDNWRNTLKLKVPSQASDKVFNNLTLDYFHSLQ